MTLTIWNVNGLCKSKPDVKQFVKITNSDILLISETHFSQRSYFSINGFDLIHTNHPKGRTRGGAVVLIKKGINYIELSEYQQEWVQFAQVGQSSPLGDLTYFYSDALRKNDTKYLAASPRKLPDILDISIPMV